MFQAKAGYGQEEITLLKEMIQNLTFIPLAWDGGSIFIPTMASMITRQMEVPIWTKILTTC